MKRESLSGEDTAPEVGRRSYTLTRSSRGEAGEVPGSIPVWSRKLSRAQHAHAHAQQLIKGRAVTRRTRPAGSPPAKRFGRTWIELGAVAACSARGGSTAMRILILALCVAVAVSCSAAVSRGDALFLGALSSREVECQP